MPKIIPFGSVSKIQNIENHVVVSTNTATLSIAEHSSGAIHFNLQFNSIDAGASTSAVENKLFTLPKYKESNTELVFTFGANTLSISKKDGCIQLINQAGQVSLLSDSLGFSCEGTVSTARFALRENERFFGLGEKTGPLDKRGIQYQNWNTDKFAYHEEDDPLYTSVPFYMGENEGAWYGVFLDNPARTHFNFGASNHRYSFAKSDSGNLDLYFFGGTHPAEIVSAYSLLTGRSPLPPLWSLGYQQCRYSYYPAEEFEILADTFRKKKIPCDVLYFDIHYMDDYKVFTWDKEKFPEPHTLLRKLHDKGFKTVAILDPGLKVEEGFEIDEEAQKLGHLLKYPDGELYTGEAWPGVCHFPDFSRPETRSWWAEKVEDFAKGGIDGLWNDMNEPAVWGKHFPDDVRFETNGKSFGHADLHNAYGGWMAEATFNGLSEKKFKRPFVLTRAGFAGIQRHAAIWTGDNSSGPGQLLLSCRMMSAMGISGMPFVGTDIGGFIGESWNWLFSRWIQVGAFQPLFRGHTMVNSADSEPWSFGEETEEICRNYINLRYRILPLIYTLFEEHQHHGLPPMRPLFLEYPNDDLAMGRAYENQFLLGSSLLICPVAQHSGLVKIYLPEGQWVDLFTDELLEGGKEYIRELSANRLPVFQRLGGFIPAQSLIQHTTEVPDREEWHIYLGAEGKAIRYKDEGDGYAHALEGAFSKRQIHWNSEEISISKKEGIMKEGKLRLYLHNFTGNTSAFESETYRWVEPISNFDPFYRGIDDSLRIDALHFVDLDLDQLTAKHIISLNDNHYLTQK